MKVMVCLKQVPHQDARLDVNADGTWIQDGNIKFEFMPDLGVTFAEGLDAPCEMLVFAATEQQKRGGADRRPGPGGDRPPPGTRERR